MEVFKIQDSSNKDKMINIIECSPDYLIYVHKN